MIEVSTSEFLYRLAVGLGFYVGGPAILLWGFCSVLQDAERELRDIFRP
jgi:hypothetical protein